jgi:hypothetical protein
MNCSVVLTAFIFMFVVSGTLETGTYGGFVLLILLDVKLSGEWSSLGIIDEDKEGKLQREERSSLSTKNVPRFFRR